MNSSKRSLKFGSDVDSELIDFINSVFAELGIQDSAKAELGDVLIDKQIEADVTLLLKTAPLLDHQQKDGAIQVMRKLPCRFLVVSFPTRTLSGKDIGMLDQYTQYFHKVTKEESWDSEKLVFGSEVAFVIGK